VGRILVATAEQIRVPMAESSIDANGIKYVNEVLESGWLSRKKYIPMFEAEVSRIHGKEYGVLVSSGTDALRIALAVLKEQNQWPDGSEVLVPSVTFMATAAVVMQNGLKPVFVDVDRQTYNMDVELAENAVTFKTVAMLPVHLFGLPAQMGKLMHLARSLKLKVVEDSCEAFGIHRIEGDLGAFSFYMAHHIQTGVGGMLVTNDAEQERLARSYANHGRSDNRDRYEFERLGYSSRLTEMEAALGCAQLENYWERNRDRQNIAMAIKHDLKGLEQSGFVQLAWGGSTDGCWMFFPVVLKKGNRDAMMKHLAEHGIESRLMMPLVNQPVLKGLVDEKDFPVAKWINENGLCLPCHTQLTHQQTQHMTQTFKDFFRRADLTKTSL
jgi:perosamine synthetase